MEEATVLSLALLATITPFGLGGYRRATSRSGATYGHVYVTDIYRTESKHRVQPLNSPKTSELEETLSKTCRQNLASVGTAMRWRASLGGTKRCRSAGDTVCVDTI